MVSAAPDGGSKPRSYSVFYFGGWNAIQANIDAWVRSAHHQQPGIAFTTSKGHLVALDGFAPDQDQRDRPSTQVWSAWGGDQKTRYQAKNYDKLKPLLQNELLEYYAGTACTTKLALHFSLVNTNATDSVVQSIATGYDKCEANLAWLPEFAR